MARTWQAGLSERIDASRPAPLYMQIIQAVIHDIESGRLASGTYLPSSRALAEMLGVNRKTVVLAYEDLIAQGWLDSTATRGTLVSVTLPESGGARGKAVARPHGIATPGYGFNAPPERPLALPGGSGLKLDEGAPDGRLFPPELLARAYRAATHRASRTNGLQYRDPRGVPELRDAIAGMLKTQRGMPVGMENICITRGSQNGIFLAAMTLLRPGDAVIMEELTYEPAMAAFQALGARIIPVGLDEGGMDLDAVEATCRQHKVKAAFVTPHHQFPTTVALRPDRRLRLVELARQHGFALIEDDYDHEFHFQSQPLLPIAAYAPDQVIHVGSLSKLLLPALRIGYIAAPAPVVDALAHMVSLSDGMGNGVTETTAAILIENGELRRHARKARQVYAGRRESFAAELRRVLGDRVDFRIPDGGLAFWLRFAGDLDGIEERARAAGLRFAGSRSFMARPDAPRGLRVGFASLNEAEAQTAIAILGRATG
ncbi:MocR-like pyridoxine biosynthesis transcription factor PdxR [Niveispirillum cyanobacteriorum]|uniref:PLP-dependent aminotransferase family protein n=1 Tax=Niveispirillum cyanobacteriorum TaxID=1612173 RepID=A0A2K9NK03_9PROT|nr:PLP-dependent aminotransferase family protein [Niveispirillum cyanobacteriorum]AUN32665.1 PLP-dependent aminotransferase family protein [Niveispirillum cyanobacteriorum]GGE83086.1 GntR family transcriptional regulator [Niveispirillum cyanobacteriorum]